MNKNGIISTEITPQLSPVIVALFSQVATLTAAQFHTINAIVMVNKEYIWHEIYLTHDQYYDSTV